MKKIFLLSFAITIHIFGFSQVIEELNAITTALPIITTTPNAAERGLGEIGVVATEFNNEAGFHQNPALLSRNKKVFGIKLSYMPWMRSFVAGNSIYDIGVYYSINKKNTIAANLYYYKTGNLSFGNNITTYNYEYFGSVKYAHSFSEHFSSGISIKYIESNIINSYIYLNMQNIKTYAGDIGFDYKNKINLANNKLKYDIGLSITNLGPKVSYSNPSLQKEFIPTSLKLGTMWTYENKITDDKQINYTIAYQAEKLLVPTPQIYDNNGMLISIDTDVPAFEAIFLSFHDAPNGFKEEMHEIIHKFGGEVLYKADNEIYYAFRAGYFSEHFTKGYRKYGTTGVGFKYKLYKFNFAYIIDSRTSPLANTFNISLGFHKTF